MTPPAGHYDIVIEASGSPHAYDQALDAVRKQGVIAILSLIQPSTAAINLHLNTLKEVSSVGSILFTSEFDEAVDLIESGTVDFNKLIAARLAADICSVPTVLVARTDADAARLVTSDIDERDRPFILDQPWRTLDRIRQVAATRWRKTRLQAGLWRRYVQRDNCCSETGRVNRIPDRRWR